MQFLSRSVCLEDAQSWKQLCSPSSERQGCPSFSWQPRASLGAETQIQPWHVGSPPVCSKKVPVALVRYPALLQEGGEGRGGCRRG